MITIHMFRRSNPGSLIFSTLLLCLLLLPTLSFSSEPGQVLITHEVTVQVSTNSGDSVEGAEVSLQQEGGGFAFYYGQVETGHDNVVFPAVEEGLYFVIVDLDYFDSFIEPNVPIYSDTLIEVQLTEVCLPPRGLHVEGSHICWYPPLDPGYDWYSSSPDKERGLLYYNVYLDGVFLYQTTDLCAPLDLIPGQFYIFGVSATYITCTSIIVLLPLTYYPCDYYLPPENVEASVNNMVVHLTWEPPISGNPGAESPSGDVNAGNSRDNRELFGYFVYRDYQRLTPNLITALQYDDEVAAPGTYRYDVTAVYTTGESCLLDPPLMVNVEEAFPPPEDFQAQVDDCNTVVFSWSMPGGSGLLQGQDVLTVHDRPQRDVDDALLGYILYLNNAIAGILSCGDTSYILDMSQYDPGTYTCCLAALYESGFSPMVCDTIFLPGIGTITGHVYDSLTSEPIQNALIVVSPFGNSALTGEYGDFSISCIISGLRDVTVQADGYFPGTGQVEVTHGDTSEINFLLVPLNIGINQVNTVSPIIIYPNPSNGILYMKGCKDVARILITDAFGHVILESNTGNKRNPGLDFSSFDNGVYWLRFMAGDGRFITVKKMVLIK